MDKLKKLLLWVLFFTGLVLLTITIKSFNTSSNPTNTKVQEQIISKIDDLTTQTETESTTTNNEVSNTTLPVINKEKDIQEELLRIEKEGFKYLSTNTGLYLFDPSQNNEEFIKEFKESVSEEDFNKLTDFIKELTKDRETINQDSSSARSLGENYIHFEIDNMNEYANYIEKRYPDKDLATKVRNYLFTETHDLLLYIESTF